MSILNKLFTRTSQEVKHEKKQEFKFLGTVKKRKGQSLFAMNPDTREVYKVPIQIKDKSYYVTKKKEVATHRAVVNPNHKITYALNLRNALRKFNK